ncbi:hypothetical protein GCM10007301_35220 [Azorhizobium oxalatiphilum]|uniref:Uncharacterized protein n=1 Tax=Azorhizobium oxalatiphilum TaxID=980631 RepID=A0A917C574_9HYPH|nr:hypothetical protein GCM10007301_35220 [Azorhizobium oxalatiphilum]
MPLPSRRTARNNDVDGRIKSGHDELERTAPATRRPHATPKPRYDNAPRHAGLEPNRTKAAQEGRN